MRAIRTSLTRQCKTMIISRHLFNASSSFVGKSRASIQARAMSAKGIIAGNSTSQETNTLAAIKIAV